LAAEFITWSMACIEKLKVINSQMGRNPACQIKNTDVKKDKKQQQKMAIFKPLHSNIQMIFVCLLFLR
jgi:hypothetical protein